MKCEVCGHKMTLADEICPSCGHRNQLDNQKYKAVDRLKTNMIKYNGRKFSTDFKMSSSQVLLYTLMGVWALIFVAMLLQSLV